MAKGDFYFPLFYKRLLTSTIGWKDDEFGAYLRLLIYQFDNGYIPVDIDDLKRIAPSIKKHWPLVSKKFKDNGNGGLVNEVMQDIYHDVQKKKSKNTGNGKLGGRPRKQPDLITETKPNGFEIETQTKPIPITNNKYQKEEEENIFHPIEKCFDIALFDQRWVTANSTTKKELLEFNNLLEKRGVYDKNPLDYKTHFANWKNSGKKDSALNLEKNGVNKVREEKSNNILNLK